eukprot:1159282-Pelagomonas_calceolata.AAC.1
MAVMPCQVWGPSNKTRDLNFRAKLAAVPWIFGPQTQGSGSGLRNSPPPKPPNHNPHPVPNAIGNDVNMVTNTVTVVTVTVVTNTVTNT